MAWAFWNSTPEDIVLEDDEEGEEGEEGEDEEEEEEDDEEEEEESEEEADANDVKAKNTAKNTAKSATHSAPKNAAERETIGKVSRGKRTLPEAEVLPSPACVGGTAAREGRQEKRSRR